MARGRSLVLLALVPSLLAAQSRHLTVYAAASLTEAFSTLGDSLRARDPGLSITFNFAGSQQLAVQIEQGAPADVFASADEHWMRTVLDSGLVDTPTDFAHNRLVVITPPASAVTDLAGLAQPGAKIVLAAPAVPVGRYARRVLRNLSRVPALGVSYGRRVLANVVSDEEDVKAVVAKVQLGEADAGIVYSSDVTASVAPHVCRIEIPDSLNVLARYPVAVLHSTSHREAARAFVTALRSPLGRRVLRANGFLPISTP